MRRTTLFFVRHGVTAHTGHKLSGRMPGVGLTDEGRTQALAAAEWIRGTKIAALYTSPLERCRETAEIIGERLSLPVEETAALEEVDYGTWTNRSMKSLAKTKLWEVVQRTPSAITFPEGESLRSVQSRSVDEVERLAAKHRGRVICCVTHADVIRVVFAHYLGIHLDLYQRLMVGPASISVLTLGDGGPLVWSINAGPRSG